MKNRTLINAAFIIVGLLLVVTLTRKGCNSDTKTIESHVAEEDHTGHIHDNEPHSEPTFDPSELDAEVDLAIRNITEGKEKGDMSMVMNEGIFRLRGVLQKDSNNTKALYHMGLLSIESGQLEKAANRFEKLILLQPENQEFKNILENVRAQMNK